MKVTPIRPGIELEVNKQDHNCINQQTQNDLNLESTILNLDELPNWMREAHDNKLYFPSISISQKPWLILSCFDASVVILLDHKINAVSYATIAPSEDPERIPELYIPRMLQELYNFKPNSVPKAIVVAGDLEHFTRILRSLSKYDIPLIGSYLSSPEIRKAIYSNPRTGETLVYSDKTKEITKLASRRLELVR